MNKTKLKFITVTLTFICISSILLNAQENDRKDYRHEIRLGIGDCLMEYIMDGFSSGTYLMKNRKYTGNLYLDYHYNLQTWLGFGMHIKTSTILYDCHAKDNPTVVLSPNNYRTTVNVYPSVRFTYFNLPSVRLYSGIGIGFIGFFYNQSNIEHNRYAGGIPITALGVSFGTGQWIGSAEIGTTFAFSNKVFSLVPMNIANIGIGYRF